jgi:hypothetical protein
MAVCKFCGDGYCLRDEGLAPEGRLADWYEHESELIRRGEWIDSAYDDEAPFQHWAEVRFDDT